MRFLEAYVEGGARDLPERGDTALPLFVRYCVDDLRILYLEGRLVMKPGETTAIAGYDIKYLGESPITGPNYTGEAGRFRIMHGDNEVATRASEKRFFEPGLGLFVG